MIDILLGLIILAVSSFVSVFIAYRIFVKKPKNISKYDPAHEYNYQRF